MKAKAVSALRSKRGLRTEVKRNAEPHPSFAVLLWRTGVVGLAPQTTNDRRTNTMKTYILRSTRSAVATSGKEIFSATDPLLPLTLRA